MINKILQAIYVFIFIFAIGLIVAMHTVPAPALALFRVPTNLREVGPSLGLSCLNIPKWRSVCKISSFLGLFLTWSVLLFFMLPLLVNSNINAVHLKTSFIYSLFAFVFLNVNLLTFAVAQKEGKQTFGP